MEKDTMAYQLAVLRDTQMVQRKLLEKQFPYIDWSKMPFSSYGDFFRLRGILDDCGAVWTNAYGRSNDEDSSTRKYLKDYSGKGRDIELFNFGWSGGSGYGLYLFNWSSGWSVNNSGSAGLDVVATSSKMSFNVTSDYAPNVIGLYRYTTFAKKVLTVRISGMRTGEKAQIAFNKGNGDEPQISIYNDGIMKVTLDDTMRALAISVSNITDKSNRHIVIEQIPNYPGAIVGDGVDDYGVCTQDFALPSDYTVVAMREILGRVSGGCIVSKSRDGSNGAFRFEQVVTTGDDIYAACYGNAELVSEGNIPKLFSYQTRTSYNGRMTLTPGTGTDTTDDKLCLFIRRPSEITSIPAALYSFGIFNRTLTADELRTVENCMYAEWICMTGKLEDIEYYDILDARFRSNSEAADKRDRWVGRFGKLHMTLHNYAFTEGSGWSEGPDYPGALVSDGVDDYAVSDEVIDEEIGGMVMLAEKISDPATTYGNIFSSSVGLGGSTGKEIAGLISKGSDSIIMGDPWTSFGKNEDAAYGLDRSPIAPNNKLMVGNNNSNEWGNAALYQLRLIKNQPTDIQLEAIKWQCRKEHEDYLIHRGWKEIG